MPPSRTPYSLTSRRTRSVRCGGCSARAATTSRINFSDVQADDRSGSALWDAVYRFPKTSREVHNRISASFLFRDGKIVRHKDDFDLYAWTRMALGPVGIALGWTPIVKGQVRKQAAAQLKKFQAQRLDQASGGGRCINKLRISLNGTTR